MIKNMCIDPTYNCNENCVSCRCKDISKQFKNRDNVSKKEYFLLIDQFVSIGGKTLSFYGGEPLLSLVIFDIISYAKKKALYTTITTNGLLLQNFDMCKKLIETNVDEIIISIMGVNETYNVMHGGNYYKNFEDAIHQLIKTDISIKKRISFHMTIQRGNQNQLPQIVNLAAELGIDNVSCQYVSLIDPADNQKTENLLNAKFDNDISHWNLNKNILINDEQVEELISSCKSAKKLAREKNINLYIDPLIFNDNASSTLVTGKCKPKGICELSDIIILPDGRVGACSMLQHYIIGDIKKESLYSILQSDKYKTLKNSVEKGTFLPICSSCCRHAMFFEK